MDISIVSKNSIKIKGKQVTFVVDPIKEMPKTNADAVIGLDNDGNLNTEKVAEFRIKINGAGEYEVGGAKISGLKTLRGTLYKLTIDDTTIIVGKTTEVKSEGFSTCQIALINTDEEFDESFVTALEPKIVILYGENNKEGAKKLGSENVTLVPKITISKDKLPEKTEVVVLG